jgi:hypothetical protein
MAVPWLRLIDTMLDFTSFALSARPRRATGDNPDQPLPAPAPSARGGLAQFEARMAGVLVAALKEAFDRDASRLQLERDQVEQERQRAERLLKLELLRQAGEREIGRLRLMAGIAVGAWIGTLFVAAALLDGPLAGRVMLGVGWLFLLAALALSFSAQSHISRALGTGDEPAAATRPEDLTAGRTGALVPWLLVLGLGVIGFGLLMV